MKTKILMYSENRTKELNFNLIKNYESDCFVTVWEEISQEDCEVLNEVPDSYTYMKVFLDNDEKAIYTGCKLKAEGMNYLLKIFTRNDYPNFD